MKKLVVVISILCVGLAGFAQTKYTPALSREAQLDKKYTSGLFSNTDGTYFDLTENHNANTVASYLNILDWLQGRVAGLQVYTFRNTKVPFLRNSPAAVFIDEVRLDPSFLNMINVNDIAMIKVMRTPFAGGWGGPGGAIAIYLKEGDEEGDSSDEE